MTQTPETEGISDSELYMWRCLVSLAHADGVFHETERAYLDGILARKKLSAAQRDVLARDYETPKDLETLLGFVTEPAHRSHLVYFARLLAWRDGDMDESEERLVAQMEKAVRDKVNMDRIRKEVQLNIEAVSEYTRINGGSPGDWMSFVDRLSRGES